MGTKFDIFCNLADEESSLFSSFLGALGVLLVAGICFLQSSDRSSILGFVLVLLALALVILLVRVKIHRSKKTKILQEVGNESSKYSA